MQRTVRTAAGSLALLLTVVGDRAPAQTAPAPAPAARPEVLNRPTEPAPAAPAPHPEVSELGPLYTTPVDPPLGFAGKSGILPTEEQQSAHFVPVHDRWRVGFPGWDRYGKGHPFTKDIPWDEGHPLDPYSQNVIKGDYPIFGDHTFLKITASNFSLFEGRQLPTPTTPFESTQRPFQEEFFGRNGQYVFSNYTSLVLDLNHGDAAFKPTDWRVLVNPVFNVNLLDVEELAIINPDVRKGTTRSRTFLALQEWFVESKLADTSAEYDFLSVRVGSQPFISDFKGFLFNDVNSGIRFFGTRNANREQYNLAYFRQREKDTNSGLNTFNDRGQDILVANYFRQDTIWPGYTSSVSLHYNHDDEDFKFDRNNFLVRPDPAGVFQRHEVNVAYFGWAGDGHINRFNITHQFYWALGRDSRSPLANQAVDINAQFFAVELSYDRDWARFRSSFLWSSGDHDISNSQACGFDTILDSPNFAGGRFSFWQRQQIGLFGVNLVQRESLVPDLRSSKIQGQSNFVNPGLFLLNFGVDMDLTPKLKSINNINFLWFDDTNVLEQFTFQRNIDKAIGTDISAGLEYRPLLSQNVVMTMGVSTLIPNAGFKQLYNRFTNSVNPMVAGFLELNLTY